MSTQIILPKWGMSLDEGTILRWLKKEREQGEPIVEIETAKSTQEVEAPTRGVLKILMAPGVTAAVNTAIGPIEQAMVASYTVVPLSPMRKIIVARMTEAKQTIPQFRLGADIEFDALLNLPKALHEGTPQKEAIDQ